MEVSLLIKIIEIALFAAAGSVFGSFGTAAAECTNGYWKRTRSKCDSCGRILKTAELIPIVSYIVQKGRCRGCGSQIPVMCLYMEIYGAFLGGISGYFLGFSPIGFLAAAMIPLIIVQTVSDIRCGMLYDWPTFLLIAVAVLYRGLFAGSWMEAAAGATVMALPLAFFVWLGDMGSGDLLLAIPFGIMLGSHGACLMLAAASSLACIIFFISYAAARAKGRLKQEEIWKQHIPFGPYICFAGYLMFILIIC